MGTPPDGSPRAVPGDVASFLQGPELAGDLPMTAGARGTVPSAEGPFGAVEGTPGLGVLTPDDFAMASSLLRSGEVERSLAQHPLEELEAQLVAAALQVSSIGYDLSGPVLGPE